MTVRNLHQKPFDEGTCDKLELYREYLREWLPVFINVSSVDILQIFDFFAGPGYDVNGNPGSPAIRYHDIKCRFGWIKSREKCDVSDQSDKFPWRKVSKEDHFWIEVGFMTKPMRVRRPVVVWR